MYLRQFADETHGCLSYLIGCLSEGTAMVVDPFRPPEFYAAEAKREGLRIHHVIDTHLHADHISTGATLAAESGAEYLLHTSTPFKGRYASLNHSDVLKIGKLRTRVFHTPGHTPDSVCLAFSDLKRGDEPWFLLTGDTLFVGDVGRPDFYRDDRELGAKELFTSLRETLRPIGDHVEVFPAHYSASSCGRYLSPKPSSTMGFERRFNPGLQKEDVESFVRFASMDLPSPPNDLEAILRANQGLGAPHDRAGRHAEPPKT